MQQLLLERQVILSSALERFEPVEN